MDVFEAFITIILEFIWFVPFIRNPDDVGYLLLIILANVLWFSFLWYINKKEKEVKAE